MMYARVTWAAALLLGVAVSTAAGDARAAKEVALAAAYDTRVPVGELRRVTPDASFSGLQARFDFYPIDALSVGVDAQYNLFQRSAETNTVQAGDATVTGTNFRYASFWSFMPTVRYYLFAGSALRPYAEIGTGVTSVTSAVLVSDLTQRIVSTSFIVQPSIGVLWRLTPESVPPPPSQTGEALAGAPRRPLESMIGLTASLTYAYTTADVVGANNVSHAGVQIGIYVKP